LSSLFLARAAAIACCAASSLASAAVNSAVPSLDELSGEWMPAAGLHSLPALNSTLGSASVANDLVGLRNLGFPPLTLSGDTGGLSIDGQAVRLDAVRWYPYQALRRGEAGGLAIQSATRLVYERRGALIRLTISNPGDAARPAVVRIKLAARTSEHALWRWAIPRDNEPTRFTAESAAAGRQLIERDQKGQLGNAFAFAFASAPDELRAAGGEGEAIWHFTLPAKGVRTIEYTLAIGETGPAVPALALDWADHFSAAFDGCQRDWSRRFTAMFTPGNPYFSGHLPVLQTSDERMRRLYYMSVVSLLSIYRTGFPVAPRVYVSNTPESNTIMMYFWDTREWATALALLDPVMMKSYLKDWLAKGIYKGYAEEYLTGTLQGPWYSANDLSIFILIQAYLGVTADRAFLGERAGGQTVLEHLDSIAVNWQTLVRPGRTLADYGEANNLLECVPTYIHEVASFNAANIWMMRQVADLQAAAGHKARAEQLRALAGRLLPAVLDLYEPGQGVWDARHRDGSRVQIRHVFDYATIGLSIPGDLSAGMRRDMTGFVVRELLVDHWMRAQSLSDPAASRSLRPDHGPMGAYCAWPGETMAAMCEFGEYAAALDLLHRCVDVTREGPFSQSRQLLTTRPDSAVVIAPGPQTYNASNGGSFAETIIRNFFGFAPELLSDTLVPHPQPPRGFTGRLIGVRRGGREFDLSSTPRGIEIQKVERVVPNPLNR
jgi:hypothetical protein